MSIFDQVAKAARTGAGLGDTTDAHAAEASRGVLSSWVPNIGNWWGQPNTANGGAGDAFAQITPQRMREIALKTPTIAAAMHAVLDFASGVKIKPRNVDPAQVAPPRAANATNRILKRPNPQESHRQWRKKLMRDLEMLGYAFVEIERTPFGTPANLWVLDAATVHVDYDKHGTILGYTQLDVVTGKPIVTPVSQGGDGVHTWVPDDILFYKLDPISESNYPTSRLAELFALGVVETLIVSFIGARFTDSNVPFGVMDLGDLNDDEVKSAVAIWNQQIAQKVNPEHNIVFTGSRGGAKWLPFGYSMKDLEAPELWSRIRLMILGILGVTVQELGEADDVNKSNGYNLSFTFKERAIKPLLDEITETTTAGLIQPVEGFGFASVELYYEDIDSRDELLQSQIDDLRLKLGMASINELRNRDGKPNVKGGDEAYVYLGGSVIPVAMLQDFAKVQLEALQMINLQTQVGIAQAMQAMMTPIPGTDAAGNPTQTPKPLPPLGTLPLLRGMQPPEKFVTPDGSGSSTTKFSMPKPALQPPPSPVGAKSSGAPAAKRPRGPVEAGKTVGQRGPGK